MEGRREVATAGGGRRGMGRVEPPGKAFEPSRTEKFDFSDDAILRAAGGTTAATTATAIAAAAQQPSSRNGPGRRSRASNPRGKRLQCGRREHPRGPLAERARDEESLTLYQVTAAFQTRTITRGLPPPRLRFADIDARVARAETHHDVVIHLSPRPSAPVAGARAARGPEPPSQARLRVGPGGVLARGEGRTPRGAEVGARERVRLRREHLRRRGGGGRPRASAVDSREVAWDALTCAFAAKGGHLELLEVAPGTAARRTGGVRVPLMRPTTSRCSSGRAKSGCPWDSETCAAAARAITWRRSSGARRAWPWSKDVRPAAWNRPPPRVRWASKNGCRGPRRRAPSSVFRPARDAAVAAPERLPVRRADVRRCGAGRPLGRLE